MVKNDHMRLLRCLILLVLPAMCLQAQATDAPRWTPGVRAGLTFLPYERSVPTVATGVYLGGQLSYALPAGSRISWSLDFGKVSNMQVFQQVTYTGLLANERIKVTEFKDFSGFSYLRLGGTVQPAFLQFGKIRLGFSAHLEGLVGLRGGYRRAVYSITYDRDITDTAQLGSSSNGPRAGNRDTPLSAADVSRLILTGGPHLVYTFGSGPQITLAVIVDGNDRLVGFGTDRSRMTFVELAYNYPLF